ncbi:PAS domain S-box-containing protein [Caulobacter sp. BK020]|nr:PAS domain S-box-containing protein [Caulobacter sp. BK020]
MPLATERWALEQLPRDLERLSRLPETWKGLDPTSIAQSVLETLLDMLALDFVGLRFNDTTHVFLRVTPDFESICSPEQIRAALNGWSAPDDTAEGLDLDGQPVRVVRCPLGVSAGIGEILAGSRRTDFPDGQEQSKLRIAASQASLACREMRELSDRRPPEDRRAGPATAQAVAESEWRLHLIINTIPAMAWSTTPDGLIDFCNQNFVDYVGWTAEEISGQGFWPIFHPDDTARLLAAWQEILATKQPRDVEGRIRRADGEYRWFVLRQNPLLDADGAIIKWYGAGADIEDRKRAEAALEEARSALLASEENLNLIINSLPVLVWSARPDGSADFINQSWRDYAGEPADKILEWGFLDLYHPDDVPGMMEIWTRDVAHNDQTALKGRIRGADGQYRWFYFAGRKLTDAQGLVRWFGCNVDIEDLMRTEEALKASEAALRDNERRLEHIINAVPGLVWSADAHGAVTFLSQQYLDYIGMDAGSALAGAWRDAVHPDDAGGLFETWAVALAQGRANEHEARLRSADGGYRWMLFRASPYFDGAGRIAEWLGVNIDIEDRKEAQDALAASEAALRDSERQLQQIVSSIPGLTWSSDARGATTFWSQQYLDYAGARLEDVLGYKFADYIHPDDRDHVMALWAEIIAAGTPGEAELRLRRADGEYRWFLIRACPFFDEHGNLTQWFGVNVDIENRKRAEEDLRQSQGDLAHVTRMTTIGELAVSIAHEVNQPLMAVVTNAGACLRWLDGPQSDIAMARQAAERIVRDGHRAGDIVTSLRNLARKSSPRMERVLLEAVVQPVLDLLGGELKRHGVSARIDLEDGAIAILGDTTQLQQVILNLTMNAVEAMAGGAASPRQLIIHANAREGEALVTVTDTGPGLVLDDTNRLFEAFFSTKAQGIGMGLSICRSIIEAHGGRIWAANNGARGGVFSFTLPLAEGHGVHVSTR